MKSLLLKIVDTLNLYPLFNRFTVNTATIFMLHGITSGSEFRDGAINSNTLIRFFEYLKKNNYNVLSLRNYIQALINKEKTRKTVVFTVDDGYRDFYLHAFEVFKQCGYPATIFLTGDFIENRLFLWWDTLEYAFSHAKQTSIDLGAAGLGKIDLKGDRERSDVVSMIIRYCKKIPNNDKLDLISRIVRDLDVDISSQPAGIYDPLSWDEIREMNKYNIDFHPHTMTHPILSQTDRLQKTRELTESRKLVESRLGTMADIFCYPNGQWEDFDEETISILKSADYIAAVTGVDGFDKTSAMTDMFRIRRFGIPNEDIMFKQYVCGLEYLKQRLFS